MDLTESMGQLNICQLAHALGEANEKKARGTEFNWYAQPAKPTLETVVIMLNRLMEENKGTRQDVKSMQDQVEIAEQAARQARVAEPAS